MKPRTRSGNGAPPHQAMLLVYVMARSSGCTAINFSGSSQRTTLRANSDAQDGAGARDGLLSW